MNERTVYKVIFHSGHLGLVSAGWGFTGFPDKFVVRYKPGEFAKPIGDSVIYCFDCLTFAERWFRDRAPWGEIWEATAQNARYDDTLLPMMYFNTIEDFWNRIPSSGLDQNHSRIQGTMVCDGLRLDKRVYL